jgi:hypothetical protein
VHLFADAERLFSLSSAGEASSNGQPPTIDRNHDPDTSETLLWLHDDRNA